MITESKVTEIFCIADDFCKEFGAEMVKKALPSTPEAPKRNRKWMMSDSERLSQFLFVFISIPSATQALLSGMCLSALETSIPSYLFLQPIRGGHAKLFCSVDNVPQTDLFR